MKKKSDKQHITPSQYQRLNEEFYKCYYSDYFIDKLLVLGSFYSQQENFLQIINSNDITIEEFTFKPQKDNPYITDIKPLIKTELTALYYHSIETFLRIFLAHSTFKPCPWLELSRESDYKKFKIQIKKLSKSNFNLAHNNWTEQEIFLNLFYCTSDLHTIKNISDSITPTQAVDYLKDWIVWSARELLEVYDYNSYKHGLSLYSTHLKVELEVTKSDNIKTSNEAMIFIGKDYTSEGIFWKKNIQFTPLGQRSVRINILNLLIKNLLASGKHRYLNFPVDQIAFVGCPPSKFSPKAELNKFNLTIPHMSVPLGYDI